MTTTHLSTERRQIHPPARSTHPAGLAVCLTALLAGATTAHAQEFTLQLEPAAAIWVDAPQAERFTPGFAVAVRPGMTFGPIFGIQGSYGFLYTPAKGEFTEAGSAHSVTMGVRIRPLGMLAPEDKQLGGLFVDFNIGYVRTGPLDRFGFDTGLGYNFQVAPTFALGPFVRYAHIVQPDDIELVDKNDAQLFQAGIAFSFGTPTKVTEEPEPAECPEAVDCPKAVDCPREKPCPEPVAATGCADKDRDGTCDVDDRCPDTAGPSATLGCPADPCTGPKLLVLVQFDYDSQAMPEARAKDPQTMDPVLDAVAAAVAQNPSCRVCVVGHTSEEGADDYNLALSRRRATAVQDYMTARGVPEWQIPTTGLGAACQMVPERSRPVNRRVEFLRLDEGESCPTTCPR
jgi:hypothetical protein